MPIYIVGDNKFVSLFEAPLSKRNAWFVFYNEAERADDDDDEDIDKGKESTHVGFKKDIHICKVERVIYMRVICVNAIINYYVVRVEVKYLYGVIES